MNKKYFSLLLLLFLLKTAIAQYNYTIKGTGDAPMPNLLIKYINPLNGILKSDTLKFNSLTFEKKITSPIHIPIQLSTDSGSYEIWSSNDFNFEINYFTKNGLTEFSAAGAQSPSYYIYNAFCREFDENLTKIFSEFSESGIDNIENYLFEKKRKQKLFIKQESEKSSVYGGVIDFIQKSIKYRYAAGILGFVTTQNLNDKSSSVQRLPALISDELKQIELNDDKQLSDLWFTEFIKYYVTYYSAEEMEFKTGKDGLDQLRKEYLFAEKKLTGEVKLFYLNWLANTYKDKMDAGLLLRCIESLKALDKTGWINKNVLTNLKDLAKTKEKNEKQNIKENKSVSENKFPFKLISPDGKEFSLSDFKGKVVYIDFWASWCGPCRAQFPFSAKLHESFSEKEKDKIVFLYISIDDKEETWKESIEKFGLKGKNGISKGGWQSEVCKYFKINSIPRYMIMDKKGDIVIPDAKRPGEESLREELLKLMAE